MANGANSSLRSLEDRVAALLDAEFSDAERSVAGITARHETAEKSGR